jgi:hypothetical protein
MKLLFVGLAKVLWLFDLNSSNPKGISLSLIFEKLTARYGFGKFPQHPADLNEQKAWAFQFGTFVNSKNDPINVAFSIYNNGFMAETMSTTVDAAEFLRDVAAWLSNEFGMVIPPEDKVQKICISQLEVEFPGSLMTLNPKLEKFASELSARIKFVDNKPRTFDFSSLNFWTEDTSDLMAPGLFRFERRWGKPFSSNQYFSQAALETHDHIKLLEELENILKP